MRYVIHLLSASVLGLVLSACSEPDAPASAANKPKQAATTDKPTKKKSMYAFDEWAGQDVKTISPTNVNDVFGVLGMSPKHKKDVYGFMGEKATMFQLRDPSKAEFLNVVNSADAMELNWIKPEETDGLESKKVSLENTQKAYQFARGILGDKGGELVKSMVENPEFKAPDIVNGKVVKAAVCEHFSCMIVIEK